KGGAMQPHKRTQLAVATVLVVLSALVGAAVAANEPFTKGDATALFNGNGGPAVLLHNPSSEVGAFQPGKRIGPGQNFQGFRVCATDWHVMFVNLAMVDSLDNVHTIDEARRAFQSLNVTYELDGAPLA